MVNATYKQQTAKLCLVVVKRRQSRYIQDELERNILSEGGAQNAAYGKLEAVLKKT